MHLTILPVILLALGQDSNEAEKLFRAAEKKLAEADSLHITATGAIKYGKEAGKFEGVVLLAKGNKSRVDVTGELAGKPKKMVMGSDGAKVKVNDSKLHDTAKGANLMLCGSVCRAGGLGVVLAYERHFKGAIDDWLTVSEFSLRKNQKVGDRPADLINYKFSVKYLGIKKKFAAQLWLDSESTLPLKRVINGSLLKEIHVTESYDLRFNSNIDAKVFELPKKLK
jgi:outer membrane lipoprotein-sorting protein